jgi:hypothetical protein
MFKKIECQTKSRQQQVRVRVIKAPLVNTNELQNILASRAQALVL